MFHRRGSKPAVAVLYQGTLSQEFSVYQVSDPGAAAGGHRGSGLLTEHWKSSRNVELTGED